MDGIREDPDGYWKWQARNPDRIRRVGREERARKEGRKVWLKMKIRVTWRLTIIY